MKWDKKRKTLALVAILMLFIASIATSIYLRTNSTDTRNKAAVYTPTTANCGKLTVGLSANGSTTTSKLVISSVQPKYYLHILNSEKKGKNCQTAFDVLVLSCDASNVCQAPRTASPFQVRDWGAFRSNASGIARVDLVRSFTTDLISQTGTNTIQFKPYGENVSWSNKVALTVVNAGQPAVASEDVSRTTKLDLRDYFVSKPGYMYIYKNQNNVVDAGKPPYSSGILRLQMEEATEYCGYKVIPWRYTKDSHNAYWNAYNPTRSNTQVDRDLRWMVAADDFKYTSNPAFDRTIWATGDRRYVRDSDKDVTPEKFQGGYFYGNVNTNFPGYYLSPKAATLPYTFVNDRTLNSSTADPKACPAIDRQGATERTGMWKIRIEKETTKKIKNYTDVIRIDFFEGDKDNNGFIREVWYMAKNVGLIQIEQKAFNGYASMCTTTGDIKCAQKCENDSDCLNDAMDKPQIVATIDRFFANPTLTVKVSPYNDGKCDGSINPAAWVDAVKVDKTKGYCLKANIPYLGYLEAYNAKGQVFKWDWNQDGITIVPGEKLKDFPSGFVSQARFRIWVPNDVFPGEKRVGDTQIPWSNQVQVTVN